MSANSTTEVQKTKSSQGVREALIDGREIALLDVREESPHAEGHPLFAANLPLSRIELEAFARLPRKAVPIVVFDDGEGLAERAAARLSALGYEDVNLLEDGLQGWRDGGYEIFQDVNAPSKAFGELVEARRHTPSLSAQEVKSLIDAKADIVIVDARRYDEFHTMSIPTATSVPGAELALRIRELAPKPKTRIIVNCAGRTRSIIGTQALINAGVPNQVAALRNGTIGWKLANQDLEHGQTRTFRDVSSDQKEIAARSAREVANTAGVVRTTKETVSGWIDQEAITVYRFDVRTPEEFERGHLPGYRSVPGGQLVQETDMFAPVRNARVVLVDDDGVRANMTASWLAQMNWEVFVVDDVVAADFTEFGPWQELLPPLPQLPSDVEISAAGLHRQLQDPEEGVVVFDVGPSQQYAKRHIPGAIFIQRTELWRARGAFQHAKRVVLTSPDGIAARFAWPDATHSSTVPVAVLNGGTGAWQAQGFPADETAPRYACRPTDRYRRPYEGNDIDPVAMQAYLDWEYGLVRQLDRDGTHGFVVL